MFTLYKLCFLLLCLKYCKESSSIICCTWILWKPLIFYSYDCWFSLPAAFCCNHQAKNHPFYHQEDFQCCEVAFTYKTKYFLPRRWYCEGKELENSPDIQITQTGDRHSLVIVEAFEEDTGRYSCFASNIYGTDSTSAEIYIEGNIIDCCRNWLLK